MRFDPYLAFDGRCAEAFRFYAELLGGTLDIRTHGESPVADQVPEAWHDRVMHAALTIGDQMSMASDVPPERRRRPRARRPRCPRAGRPRTDRV